MADIRLGTAGCVRAFQALTSTLNTCDSALKNQIDAEALGDELGRFRVWSGNLGALQKGHSSLDYRLRDSPLLSSNVLKLLAELRSNLIEADAVLSGARLPYEQQTRPVDVEEDSDDGFFSEDDDDSEDGSSKTELEQRFWEVIDIIDNLYKLSVRIRSPTLHSRSLKAASFRLLDPETGVDMFDQYGHFDLLYTRELLYSLRESSTKLQDMDMQHDYLVHRLSKAITLRRRQFKYWRRHRDKLGTVTGLEDILPDHSQTKPMPELLRHVSLQVNPENVRVTEVSTSTSEKVPKSLLSGTEATHHHRSLDELVDSKSVTSYATTTRDITGRGIDLPSPPRAADGEKDFECPYCYIICPARYGNGRAWRTHLLQDLQPYVCTYEECHHSDQLFRSRREWSEHESTHRKLWRCPEHLNAIYRTQSGLEDHLHHEHANSIADDEISSIVRIGETSEVDAREKCPICFAAANMEGGLQNHIANHLERLASFALPKDIDSSGDASNDAGSAASLRRGTASISSQDLTTESSQTGSITADAKMTRGDSDTETDNVFKSDEPLVGEESGRFPVDGGEALSSALLNDVPDDSEHRIDILLSTNLASQPVAEVTARDEFRNHSHSAHGDSVSTRSTRVTGGIEGAAAPFLRFFLPDEIPSIHSMYALGRLRPRNSRYPPNVTYNQILSFSDISITQLKVDAIVKPARSGLRASRSKESLDYHIRQSAGPGLREECQRVGLGAKVGDVRVTSGYDLPCQKIIHAINSGFDYSKEAECFDNLARCYKEILKVALQNQVKTVAIPALCTGGYRFPSLPATETALAEIRQFLDDNQNHPFEKIIFLVTNEATKHAYELYLPVFFPPVEEDTTKQLEEGPQEQTDDININKSLDLRLTRLIQWLPKIFGDLTFLTEDIGNFPSNVFEEVEAIADTLGILKDFLELDNADVLDTRISSDVERICNTLETLGGTIGEMVDGMLENKGTEGAPTPQQIWDQFSINLMKRKHHSLRSILDVCQRFVRSLNDMISREIEEPHDMQSMREKLSMFFHESSDEVFHVREYQNRPLPDDITPFGRIPSLSRLYQIGELEYRPTNSLPDNDINHTICLVRGDITKLGVDVIVNSTDLAFSGVGTLDKSIFRLGGPEMQSKLISFGLCQAGDVRVTPGYGLPCKHVVHAVPPELYRVETKHLLRKCYREALFVALGLSARSIAFPTIGTGALGHPRRDAARLAIEEVKDFLESNRGSALSSLEKIVFCVFGEDDEFLYKAMLPLYFPPIDNNVNKSLAETSSQVTEGDGTTKDAIEKAPSGSKSGEESTSRPLNAFEHQVLTAFEAHATKCPTCKDPAKLYAEDRELCSEGYHRAQNVLRFLYMRADGQTYSVNTEGGFWNGTVQVPSEYPISKSMLLHTEKSYRDVGKNRPFVTPNQSWADRARARGTGPSVSEEVQPTQQGLLDKAIHGTKNPSSFQEFTIELEERVAKQSLSVEIDTSEVNAFNKSHPTRKLGPADIEEVHSKVKEFVLDYVKSRINNPSRVYSITLASAIDKLVNLWMGHWYLIAQAITEVQKSLAPSDRDYNSHIAIQVDRYTRTQLELRKVDMFAGPPTLAFGILSKEEITAFYATGVGFEAIDKTIARGIAFALENKLQSKVSSEKAGIGTLPSTVPVTNQPEEEEEEETKAFASVFFWYIDRWEPLHSGECIVAIRTGNVEIHTITDNGDDTDAPLLSFELPPSVPIVKGTTSRDIIIGDSRVASRLRYMTGTWTGDYEAARNKIMFRTSTPEDCTALLETLTNAGSSDPALVAGQKAQRITPQSRYEDPDKIMVELKTPEPQSSHVLEASSGTSQEEQPSSFPPEWSPIISDVGIKNLIRGQDLQEPDKDATRGTLEEVPSLGQKESVSGILKGTINQYETVATVYPLPVTGQDEEVFNMPMVCRVVVTRDKIECFGGFGGFEEMRVPLYSHVIEPDMVIIPKTDNRIGIRSRSLPGAKWQHHAVQYECRLGESCHELLRAIEAFKETHNVRTDSDPQPSPSQGRWAQIRKDAAERAARLAAGEASDNANENADDEESIESRVSRIKKRVAELTGDTKDNASGNTGDEESLESRVARIKARVAELTGDTKDSTRDKSA